MIVRKSSVFPAARETVFEKLQKLETLQYIARPYATFEPVGAAKLVWEAGSTSAYRFRLFGVIPFGTHKIYIVRFDPEGVSSREGNEHVPVWNHDITMVPLDGSHTKYTDRVEIRAGWKTPFIWLWANAFYTHRQRKWIHLLKEDWMMARHMTIEQLPYGKPVQSWLKDRYGETEANQIWEQTQQNYRGYLRDLPDYGGSKNGHARAIYGGLLIFSLYPALPDQPPVSELQDFVQNLFMGPFTKLGKIFDLNRPSHMWLIDKVFRKSGNRDRKDLLRYPEGFINIDAPYDKEHHAASYSFTQCPNAEFAKKHGLLHILPLLCNSDFFGISEIHGTLIRCGTCGNSDVCDYLVVGSDNPMAAEYVTVSDEQGFLVSRKRLPENFGE